MMKMEKKYKNIATKRFALFVISLVAFICTQTVAQEFVKSGPDQSILIVNSFHPGYSWADDLLKGELRSLKADYPDCIFLIEYMDYMRFPGDSSQQMIKESLELKLKTFQPDVIIVNDNPAFDFVLKCRDELFPDKPVVFAGYNGFESIADTLPDYITGVAEQLHVRQSVGMILDLHPALKEITILSSDFIDVKGVKSNLEKELKVFDGRVKIQWHDYESFSEVVECSCNSASECAILVGSFSSVERGVFYSQDDVVAFLAEVSNVPVYSLYHTKSQRGVIGLGMISGEQHGKTAGQLALQILGGVPVADLSPVVDLPWHPKFDAEQFLRWGISRNSLPDEAVVLNFGSTFYAEYKKWIWLVVGVTLLQSIFIVIMVFRRIYERLKRDLALSRTSFNSIMDSSPFISIIVTDVAGKITLFNSGSEKMLGYTQDDVKGLNILDCLCPEDVLERFKNELREKQGIEAHERELMEYVSKEKDKDIDTVYICKDGGSCYVDITVSPINDNRGNTHGYLVVATDLTAVRTVRRQLEESRQFLRSVIDAIPVRVFWKDLNSVYMGCNRVFAADARLDSTDMIIGRSDSEMHWGALAESYVKDDSAVMSSRISKIDFEEFFVTMSGSIITIRTSKIPLFGLNDEVIGVLGMYEDITDYKRMQEIVEKRIVSLTRYVDDPDAVEFEKLFNVDEIQRIQDEFSDSTNVSSVIVNPDGEFITKSSNLCSLCKLVMNLKTENCDHCFRLTSGLIEAGTDKPMFRRCEGSGLSMAVSPVFVGGIHVASWIMGQVRIELKDDNELKIIAEKSGVDPQLYIKAYNDVFCMTEEKFESVANSAHTLCSQLSIFAAQNIQQAKYIAMEKMRMAEIRRYLAAMQQIPDAVIILDENHIIRYVNPAFSRMNGYSLEEVVGQHPIMLHDIEGNSKTFEELKTTVDSGKVWRGSILHRRKDGTIYTGQGSVSTVFDMSGKVVNFVAYMRDITQELIREEELNHRQKMGAVGQLASGVAHDFNNILQAILGFCELLTIRFDPESVD